MGTGGPKQLKTHAGKSLLEWTLSRFEHLGSRLEATVIPLPKTVLESPPPWLKAWSDRVHLIEGGRTRQESVLLGLRYLADLGQEDSLCLVHDAARPLVSEDELQRCIASMEATGTGICLGIPVRDTIKDVEDDLSISHTVDRSRLWQAQTPQGAPLKLLLECSEAVWARGIPVTDDASILEAQGVDVSMVEGHALNFKVTRPDDWELFTRLTPTQP